MYGKFIYIWILYGVNVGKYYIHGAFGGVIGGNKTQLRELWHHPVNLDISPFLRHSLSPRSELPCWNHILGKRGEDCDMTCARYEAGPAPTEKQDDPGAWNS